MPSQYYITFDANDAKKTEGSIGYCQPTFMAISAMDALITVSEVPVVTLQKTNIAYASAIILVVYNGAIISVYPAGV